MTSTYRTETPDPLQVAGGTEQIPQTSILDDAESGSSIGEHIATLLEYKWLIAAITGLAILIGGIRAYLETPVYVADGLLQVEESASGFAALESFQPLMEQSSPVSAELEILGSRMILGKVVDALQLDLIARPTYFPVFGEAVARRFSGDGVAKPWLGQAEYAWGGESIDVQRLELPQGLLGRPLPLEAGANGAFTLWGPGGTWHQVGEVGVRLERSFGDDEDLVLFVSRLKARTGARFELIRKPRVKAINALADRLSVSEKGRSGIVTVRLKGSEPAELQETLDKIMQVYVRQNVERRSAEAENTLQFLETQLPALKQRLDAAEDAYNSYRLEQGSVDLTSETQLVLASVVEVDNQLILLQQEREEQRQRFKTEHPRIKAFDAKIHRLIRKQERLDGVVAALPGKQQKLLRLKRDVTVNLGLYVELLNSAQELRIAKAGTVGNARIIDSAEVSFLPIKPKKKRILVLSAFLGIFASLGLIWIARSLRVTVDDPEKIERALALPVLATVPHSKEECRISRNSKKPNSTVGLLAEEAPNDDAIESLRSLQTSLHFVLLNAPRKGLLVVGPSPQVGKSFLSKNLGAVLAQSGSSVVVVDGDLRRGHLHRELGLSRGPGVTDFVSTEMALDDLIRHTLVEGLDLVTTGLLPPNPTELLMHPRFEALIESLLKRYDHVIVDAAPILAVADAAIIGRYLGTVLMVARAGRHPIRELEQAVKRMNQAGVNVSGFVLNDLDTTRIRYRYGYGGYHYQYKHE